MSCPLGEASLYKPPLDWEPTEEEGKWLTKPPLRSETALTSCLQPNGNPEGINTKATWAWSAQRVSLILRGRLLLGHQGTGDPLGPMAGAPGSLAACSQEASWVFRALGQTCAARLTSNADGTVRTMQSQQALQTCPATSRRSSRTKGVKGYWGFINGCTALSSTGGRIHSHHPHNQLSMHSRPWLT